MNVYFYNYSLENVSITLILYKELKYIILKFLYIFCMKNLNLFIKLYFFVGLFQPNVNISYF